MTSAKPSVLSTLFLKALMFDSQGTDFLHWPGDLTAQNRPLFVLCCASTSPSHEQHMANLAGSMKEINLDQTDCFREDGHCGPLRFPEDLVYLCFMRDLLPQPSSHPLSNDYIPIHSTCDFEQHFIPSTISKLRVIVVNISIRLPFGVVAPRPQCWQGVGSHIHLLVHLHIWAVVIQFATLLQIKQTLLCAKLCYMFLILAASFMLNARSACEPLSRWERCDLS